MANRISGNVITGDVLVTFGGLEHNNLIHSNTIIESTGAYRRNPETGELEEKRADGEWRSIEIEPAGPIFIGQG